MTKKVYPILVVLLSFFILLVSCSDSKEEPEPPTPEPPVVVKPPVISELQEKYALQLAGELQLTPAIANDSTATYSWQLNGVEVATTKSYTFNAAKAGKYTLKLTVTNDGGVAEKSTLVIVYEYGTTLSTSVYTILPIDGLGIAQPESAQWEVAQAPSDLYRLSYTNTNAPLFIAAKGGEYHLLITSGDDIEGLIIDVDDDESFRSPYIAQVFDYLPAPGQFVNELPKYEAGDKHKDMVRKAGEWLVGEDASPITLGGWGGYVTFGFDHTIVNVAGKRDFRINGNAFGATDNSRPNAPFGGSCEPGVIMVAYDKNGNGEPDDDEWYEIAGSSSFSAEEEPWYGFAKANGNDLNVYRDYQMTYYKPTSETPEVSITNPGAGEYITIQHYIRWTDNKGSSGYKVKNAYHAQTYYPAWVATDQLTYTGVRLPQNSVDESGKGSYFVLYAPTYGYVDSYPNLDDRSAIDIDWAIDKSGKKANLPGIDFVKVYCGVNQQNGWLGECSTEVERGEDLHLLGVSITNE